MHGEHTIRNIRHLAYTITLTCNRGAVILEFLHDNCLICISTLIKGLSTSSGRKLQFYYYSKPRDGRVLSQASPSYGADGWTIVPCHCTVVLASNRFSVAVLINQSRLPLDASY
eukprot:scaffold268294_cov21-Prasinocladus_malaysianus.AAC.1